MSQSMAVYDFPDTTGQPTDGSFEYTSPDGTLYEWNGYAWVVPGDGTSGSAQFVKVVGDNMTGDLTLGTDKITLDAADGSATFGQAPLDNTDGKTGDYGAAFSNNGRLTLGRAKGATAFQIYNQTDPAAAVVLNSNGSATFAGTVTSANSFAIQLEADNSANYTTTTDSEGVETQVYNGPTLDVKEVGLALVALKAAAANATDFTSLKSAIATSLANI